MLTLVLLLATQQAEPWHQLAKGIEYRQILIDPANPAALLHAVRFEVDQIEFRFALRSKAGGAEKTVGKWVDEAGFLVGINAGMFGKDRLTNIGRLVDAEHRNQSVYNDYQSALVFAPKQEGLPYAQILDLDVPGTKETASHYHSMVQNLRLIKAPGVSVWGKSDRAWSEAAVAQDDKGRLLFLFIYEPYDMKTFNRLLLASPLRIIRAFHVDGGPYASLSLRTGKHPVDLYGNFESDLFPRRDNQGQMPLPNVLGVRYRARE